MTPHNRALLTAMLDPSSTRCTDEVRALMAEMAAIIDAYDDHTLQMLNQPTNTAALAAQKAPK